MKTLVVLFAVLALSCSAPQPKKLFHEHVEDFLTIIYLEAEDDLEEIFDQYEEFEEFKKTLDFMQTTDFKNLVYEMESLPEFKAMTDFLENVNIDITFFIDFYKNILEVIIPEKRTRQQISGKDFESFVADSIAVFPKSKLSALFDQKMAEDEEFRTAIESLQSEEWNIIWIALWENETFKAEAEILNDNGINLIVLLDEVLAIFGQN